MVDYLRKISDAEDKPTCVNILFNAAMDDDMYLIKFDKILKAATEKYPDIGAHLVAMLLGWN